MFTGFCGVPSADTRLIVPETRTKWPVVFGCIPASEKVPRGFRIEGIYPLTEGRNPSSHGLFWFLTRF